MLVFNELTSSGHTRGQREPQYGFLLFIKSKIFIKSNCILSQVTYKNKKHKKYNYKKDNNYFKSSVIKLK